MLISIHRRLTARAYGHAAARQIISSAAVGVKPPNAVLVEEMSGRLCIPLDAESADRSWQEAGHWALSYWLPHGRWR